MVITNQKTTLSQLVSRFLSRPNLAPATIEYYSTILSNFKWYAQWQRWPDDPNLITRDHIREFLEYVATETYRWPGMKRCSMRKARRGTVHHYGKVVKTFFNWAKEEEYIDDNPSLRLRLGHPHYKEVQPYSDDEVRAMLEVCDYDCVHRYRFLGFRNKAIISLLTDTGLRLSELGAIRLSDLEPKLRQVRVMGKGSKLRVVAIDGEARKALRNYLEIRPRGGDELWKTDDGQPMSTYSIKVMIARLKHRAGVTSGGGAHRFRHYFATRYLENGGDINSLRLLLGHQTLDMVLRYSRCVDASRAVSQQEFFSPLDRLYNGGRNHNRGSDGWGWRG